MRRTGTKRGPWFSEMCQQSCDVIKPIRRCPHRCGGTVKMLRDKSTGFDSIISWLVYGHKQGTNDKSVKANKNVCEVPMTNMIDNLDQSLMHVP